jgi:hypothetical protein
MKTNASFIGTIRDAIPILSETVLHTMSEKNKDDNYIFRVTVINNKILIW